MHLETLAQKLQQNIRQVPDFPKKSINFYDITTILRDGPLFHEVISAFAEHYRNMNIDAFTCIEARGFILGAALAHSLRKPFIPIRKHGKLPAAVERQTFALEYGEDSLEIHCDAFQGDAFQGDAFQGNTRNGTWKTVLVDDVIATGGTARAAIDLIERLGAVLIECCFMLELSVLNGRAKLSPIPVFSLLEVEQ